jgi:hypothetical protein
MIGSMPLDLTPLLAPFGWAAATIVIVGLAAIVVTAMRARRTRPDRAVEPVRAQDPRLAA